MSLLKPILRPALRSTLSSITSAIRRYFTTFDPVAQTYVQLSSPVVLAGDFRHEWKSQLSADDFLFGGDGIDSWIGVDSGGGNLIIKMSTKQRSAPLPAGIDLNSLHHFYIEKSGPTTTVNLNGNNILVTNDFAGSTYVLETVGTYGTAGGQFFNGVIADVKVQDAGTLVLDMPLDGSDYESSAIVANKQTALGSEIVTNGNFVDGSNNWATGGSGSPTVSITDGQASVEATVTGSAIFEQSLTLSSASTYIIDVTLVGQTAGFPSVYYFTGSSVLIGVLSEGRNRLIFTPGSDATKLRIGFLGNINAGEHFTIDDVSIREIPAANPLGTAINFAAADTELYTLQNGAWVSDTKTIPVA